MRMTVLGCGYLGTTHAACMADLGYDVLGVESDPGRLESLRAGRVPFYEPGLEHVLRRAMESGRLTFTASLEEAARFADVHFLCVGTPQLHDSYGADMTYVNAAVEQLAPHVSGSSLLIGKSTVPVGTASALAQLAQELAPPRHGAGRLEPGVPS